MHDVAVPTLKARGWTSWPEVSFSVFGERGVIDLFAWLQVTRKILVVELKTEIVDANELVATLDRKRRLAIGVARDRGLDPILAGSLLLVADSATNRRRVTRYDALLRAALPARGSAVRRWLRDPHEPLSGLLLVSYDHPGNVIHGLTARKRVRTRRGTAGVRRG